MKIAQFAKRIFLFAVVNILVIATITAILGLLGAGHYMPRDGLACSPYSR